MARDFLNRYVDTERRVNRLETKEPVESGAGITFGAWENMTPDGSGTVTTSDVYASLLGDIVVLSGIADLAIQALNKFANPNPSSSVPLGSFPPSVAPSTSRSFLVGIWDNGDIGSSDITNAMGHVLASVDTDGNVWADRWWRGDNSSGQFQDAFITFDGAHYRV